MFEKIIILLLFIISFVYIKYIIKKYKNSSKNNKSNLLLLEYSFYQLKVFIYFLIPFYILLILAITIFWKTENIDKILTITILFIFLIISIIFVLFVLKIKKRIVMEDSLFIYTTLFYTKKLNIKICRFIIIEEIHIFIKINKE